MLIYISGPITGHDDYLEKFKAAEDFLKRQGHDVINPAWINEPFAKTNARHGDFLTACLRMMAPCDAVYMLDGWKTSEGAKMEYKEAQRLKMWIMMEAAGKE